MIFFVFFFGLVVGSFLNAVIYRLEVNDSAFRGRSYCPHCTHALAWYDLIPVVSFLLLQGRCRSCKGNISWQYPLVEIATGLVFVHIFHFSFPILHTLYLFSIASLLIILFVYDLKHYILPDKIMFPAMGIVLGYRAFEVFRLGFVWDLGFVVSGFSAASFFLAIFLASRGRAMGFGDVKLAALMGFLLGWPNIVVALFAAFMLGGAVGIALFLLKKKQMKSEVPFGPFLIAGTFGALFWGDALVDWYLAFLLV